VRGEGGQRRGEGKQKGGKEYGRVNGPPCKKCQSLTHIRNLSAVIERNLQALLDLVQRWLEEACDSLAAFIALSTRI
jgi:hypothetical protein